MTANPSAADRIMAGSPEPQHLGGGRWAWGREALEVEILHALEDYRKRVKAELLSHIYNNPWGEFTDEDYGKNQGYENAAEYLDDVPLRVDE